MHRKVNAGSSETEGITEEQNIFWSSEFDSEGMGEWDKANALPVSLLRAGKKRPTMQNNMTITIYSVRKHHSGRPRCQMLSVEWWVTGAFSVLRKKKKKKKFEEISHRHWQLALLPTSRHSPISAWSTYAAAEGGMWYHNQTSMYLQHVGAELCPWLSRYNTY